MKHSRATKVRRPALACAGLAVALMALLPLASARADEGDGTATVRLIQLLIEKGVLTQDQAASLLKQAREESRAKPKPPKPAAAPAPASVPAQANLPAAEPPPPAPGTVRVTYVPQIVRDQIAGEVRQQVMQQVQSEGWAAPNAAPDWTKRIRLYGDVRMRGQQTWEGANNSTAVNFNAINNSNTGFDPNNGTGPPTLNTTQNRTQPILRARLGVQAQIDDWVSTTVGFATGNDNSPVSTNQTLGSTGDFTKYGLWLDQAYIAMKPFQSLKMYVGRAPNPFWTTDLMYFDELNFDGASVQGAYPINGMMDMFASAGAFSIYNTALDFSTFNQAKFPSHDKYLFAGQAGVQIKPTPDWVGKFAAGFFAYTDVDGKLSDPCTIFQSTTGCDTDATRAQFVQYGNTLYAIRNVLQTGTSSADPQYFGLASRFQILDLHGRVDYTGFHLPVSLEAEFAKNFGYDRKLVTSRIPVNDLGSGGVYQGGDSGYMVKLTVGKTEIAQRWDWNAFVAYKYVESDAVLDALDDPNFHGGGTNAKGFILGANLGLARNLSLSARWYSATSVAGPVYANDLVQVDLSARF